MLNFICREISHYYRALNYAIHHMKEDNVCFERNGLMLDCSRNAVFTVEKVKSKTWNECKREDTYEVEGQSILGLLS